MRTTVTLFFLTLVQACLAQLVLPGDFPDPSVVKINDRYWASATTSNWAPAFPLLSSSDLITWDTKGVVFPTLPAWADYYFWAPEITHENGKVYVYYSAHKKDGNLCIAVASADKPEGPYKDHGPLMCETVGSIDAFPMRDENGVLYMIWKEDGNSVNQPTPIWAMKMNEERTQLLGEKIELFRNDKPWEGNLVEGVSMIKKGNYYYAFYAAAACCGRECNYATGIARAEKLLGPWEKFEQNPIMNDDPEWKCPGHGTPVIKDGKYYFLYHAYHTKSDVYTGRQGLLKEFIFTDDGWVKFLDKTQQVNVSAPAKVEEEFNDIKLSLHWQWSVFDTIQYNVKNGSLALHAAPTSTGSFVGHKTFHENYSARLVMIPGESVAEGGLALIGDERNMVFASYVDGAIRVTKIQNNEEKILLQERFKIKRSKNVHFQLRVRKGNQLVFFYSRNGKKFVQLNAQPVDGSYLPPWDRALRVGLFAKGKRSDIAVFDRFAIIAE